MPHTIAVSTLFLKPGKVGGAEFMVKNLLHGLNAVRADEDRLFVISDARWQVRGRQHGLVWRDAPRGKNRFTQAWKAVNTWAREADGFLLPNYFTPPTPALRHTRAITVIHDLQYIHYPEHFSIQKRAWLRIAHKMTLRKADRVVVLSEFVRQDVLTRYGNGWAHKLSVIPNPIDFERFDGEADLPPTLSTLLDAGDHRILLSVAAHYPHKNLATLIRAFAMLANKPGFDDVKLVLVGQLGKQLIGMIPGRNVEGLIHELKLDDRVFTTGFISSASVGMLYRQADVFVFPSLFEGFGMPAVEALGFGLPVLTTRCASLPEVTLGMAHYVDEPTQPGAWADALITVLRDPKAHRLTPAAIDQVRSRYAPELIGKAYYRLLTAS